MKKVSALIATGSVYFIMVQKAFALSVDPCPSDQGTTTWSELCKITLGGGLFSAVITTAFIVASLIALAFLVYGGIRWITSGGDKSGVESARNIIVAALVGLVITFLAYLLITIIFNFFGLEFGTFTLPSITATKE
jgi:hypothetical protein